MTIILHEWKRGRISLAVWAAVICSMLGLCILIYPEMSSQMGEVSAMFADMGGFSKAFGMDQINFGEFLGFFGVECGNVLGLGGAFFAAITGISALAKEEREHTAEFLLTHPVSRTKIIAQKLCAVALQIVVLNLAVLAVTVLCVLAIGETADAGTLALLFLAYFIMQLEIAAVTFGISALISRGSVGVGLGLAAVFYFLNIVANLTEKARFLKYITPFGYTDSADIITGHTLNAGYLAVGTALAGIGIATAFLKYGRKDIA